MYSRSAGPRLEKNLNETIPLLDAFCDADKPVEQSDCNPQVVDLREASLLVSCSFNFFFKSLDRPFQV
jgi:hypothetical protein